MVYEISWTNRAVQSYGDNISYLEKSWTEKEVVQFINLAQEKLTLLSAHPEIGAPRNKKSSYLRHTVKIPAKQTTIPVILTT